MVPADVLAPAEPTVIRPRPGAGRRGVDDTVVSRRGAPSLAPADAQLVPARFYPVAGGLNPLVQAASPVLLLAGRLRHSLSGFDTGTLKRHALEEIRRFEGAAHAAAVPREVVLAARYALCSTVDEAILSTAWGGQSDWGRQSLLVLLHREAWGGERFFDVLEGLMRDPARHRDLIELHYLCLAVGFMGRYHVLERGRERLADVRHAVYQTIRRQTGAPPSELSLRWKGLEDRRSRLVRYVPWWVVGAGALAVLTATFATYYAWLGRIASPTYGTLANTGRQPFTQATPNVAPHTLRLKALLASQEASGLLSIVEEGARTRVVVNASDLFASGSATPNHAYTGMLRDVGAAIERVPGRVLVEGHTDDQALRSFRYKNNFELSRERAANVVRILGGAVTNSARLDWTGLGSSEPRFAPESRPENRARNRRVEIVHVIGS